MNRAEREVLRGSKDGVPARKDLFPETQYGIVKRIQVIEEWVHAVKERMGKPLLAILDYGCGTGDHITFPLAQAENEVLGIDVHAPSILEARRKYALPNLSFRVGDLQDLSEKDLGFEVIVCSEVLEHLENPREFMEGLRRLLRPGSALIITTPNGYGSFEMLHRLERMLSRIGVHQAVRWGFWQCRKLIRRVQGRPLPATPLAKMPGDQDPGFLNQDSVHVQFFRLGALERLFSDSGFRVVARRARTLLCGPYVDVAFRLFPCRQTLFRLNNRLADVSPFSWAADWMFLLEQKENAHP